MVEVVEVLVAMAAHIPFLYFRAAAGVAVPAMGRWDKEDPRRSFIRAKMARTARGSRQEPVV